MPQRLADFVGGVQPGQHDAGRAEVEDPAQPNPRRRLARTTVGTPYAAAARTTVPTCSSRPRRAPDREAPSRSRRQRRPRLRPAMRCPRRHPRWCRSASRLRNLPWSSGDVTVVRLSVVLDVIRTTVVSSVPFRTRSATARRCPRRTPRRVRRPTRPQRVAGRHAGWRDHDDDRSVVIAGVGERVTHFGGRWRAGACAQAAAICTRSTWRYSPSRRAGFRGLDRR